jgi:hypothetical protein
MTEVAVSVLHAMALPENDPDSRAAAICRAHGRAVHHRATRDRAARDRPARDLVVSDQAAHGQTARAQAAPGQTARAEAARDQAVRSQAARAQATDVPLRLTRRGRVVIAVATAILVAVVSLIAAKAVQATSRSAPPRVAEQALARVVVRPGQSLWSVAERADPGADTRQVIEQIVELNGLAGDAVVAGQWLWVPRG